MNLYEVMDDDESQSCHGAVNTQEQQQHQQQHQQQLQQQQHQHLRRVLYDFEAENEGDLSATRDDIIIVYEWCDSGWILGKLYGDNDVDAVTGWFPTEWTEEYYEEFDEVEDDEWSEEEWDDELDEIEVEEEWDDDACSDEIYASMHEEWKKTRPMSTISDDFLPIEPTTRPTMWRDYASSSIRANMSKDALQRQEVIYEIINTEEDYVRDLDNIVSSFIVPMRKKQITSRKNMAIIFSNIEQFLPVNIELLRSLKAKQSEGPVVDMVGDIFVGLADFFKIYTLYCSNYALSLKLLEKERERKKFKTFVEVCEDKGMTLESYLIKPVQRICKYPLLLRELVKVTSSDSPDYDAAVEAKARIEAVVAVVNEADRASSNSNRLVALQARIKTPGNVPLNLVTPSRHLLREATVKETLDNGKFGDREMFLFDDLVLVTSKISKSKKLLLQLSLPLDASLFRFAGSFCNENNFDIVYTGGSRESEPRRFIVHDAKEWVDEANSAKANIIQKRQQRTLVGPSILEPHSIQTPIVGVRTAGSLGQNNSSMSGIMTASSPQLFNKNVTGATDSEGLKLRRSYSFEKKCDRGSNRWSMRGLLKRNTKNEKSISEVQEDSSKDGLNRRRSSSTDDATMMTRSLNFQSQLLSEADGDVGSESEAVDIRDESIVISAVEKVGKSFVYVIKVYSSDSESYVIHRKYQEFFNLHMALIDAFPKESGTKGDTRSLPYLPGQKLIITEAVAKGRIGELEEYLQLLVGLPTHIRESYLVKLFLSVNCQIFGKGGVPKKMSVLKKSSSEDTSFEAPKYAAANCKSSFTLSTSNKVGYSNPSVEITSPGKSSYVSNKTATVMSLQERMAQKQRARITASQNRRPSSVCSLESNLSEKVHRDRSTPPMRPPPPTLSTLQRSYSNKPPLLTPRPQSPKTPRNLHTYINSNNTRVPNSSSPETPSSPRNTTKKSTVITTEIRNDSRGRGSLRGSCMRTNSNEAIPPKPEVRSSSLSASTAPKRPPRPVLSNTRGPPLPSVYGVSRSSPSVAAASVANTYARYRRQSPSGAEYPSSSIASVKKPRPSSLAFGGGTQNVSPLRKQLSIKAPAPLPCDVSKSKFNENESPYDSISSSLLNTRHDNEKQLSDSSSSGDISGGLVGDVFKLKVHLEDQVIVIKLALGVSFAILLEKIAQRQTKVGDVALSYQDEDGDMIRCESDDDLHLALESNPYKLVLYGSIK